MRYWLFISFIFLTSSSNAQVISTIAGNGYGCADTGAITGGFSGDGGPAINAAFYFPEHVAFDSIGNLYVSDIQNYRVRKISTSGIITTFAGNGIASFSGDGGPATNASINSPSGIICDIKGNVYICDYSSNRIRKIDSSGIIRTFAGNGVAGFAGDGGPASAAKLNGTACMAIDSIGNIYVSDQNNNRIRKIDTFGIITTFAGNGTGAYSGDGGAATAAEINKPNFLLIDKIRNVYIADYFNNRVRKVDSSGLITTFAGNGTPGFNGDGGAATVANLHYSTGMVVDKKGNIYIADAMNNRIRIVDTFGTIKTIAGIGTLGFSGDGGLASAAQFKNPLGLAIDKYGALYIADQANNRIRKISGTLLTEDFATIKASSLHLFPNPIVNGMFSAHFVSSDNEPVKFTITNLLGTTVKEFQGNANSEIEVNTDLPNGMYLVTAISVNGRFTGKITICK